MPVPDSLLSTLCYERASKKYVLLATNKYRFPFERTKKKDNKKEKRERKKGG